MKERKGVLHKRPWGKTIEGDSRGGEDGLQKKRGSFGTLMRCVLQIPGIPGGRLQYEQVSGQGWNTADSAEHRTA